MPVRIPQKGAHFFAASLESSAFLKACGAKKRPFAFFTGAPFFRSIARMERRAGLSHRRLARVFASSEAKLPKPDI